MSASSELRTDVLTGTKVLIAAHRAERPHDFGRRQYERLAIDCPFCPGHEDQTPVELLLATTDLAPAGRKSWQVRVVPNKYPALAPLAASRPSQPGQLDESDATGIQEVIIESPRHILSLGELSAREAEAVFLVYRERMRALRQSACGEHLLAFKNVGPGAGSSVEHTHSQLVALPHMPEQVRGHVLRAAEHLTATGTPLWDDLLAAERADGRRIIAETKHLVAFCPYASRVAYETRIVPKSPALRFEEQPESLARECAGLTHRLIKRLERELDRPDYNYLLFTAPASVTDERHYRWHLLLFPRLTVQAGFEWGTGMFINSVAPEAAAAALRT